MMLRLAILATIAATGLGGCGDAAKAQDAKERQLAECEVDANRTFPQGPILDHRAHIRACMRAHGYTFSVFVGKTTEPCASDLGLSYHEPACFHDVSEADRAP